RPLSNGDIFVIFLPGSVHRVVGRPFTSRTAAAAKLWSGLAEGIRLPPATGADRLNLMRGSMSNNRTSGLRGGRVVGIGAAATIAVGLFSAGAANADTFVPLPDGEKLGPGVTITRTGEHAVVSPSLAANGAGRVAWVSGNATADVTVTPEGEEGPNNGPSNAPGT